MTDPVFLDTNLIVYVFDDDEPAKQEVARTVLASSTREGTARISIQVLQEFYVAVTRKLQRPLSHTEAEAAVVGLSALPVVSMDEQSVMTAVSRCGRESISLWDSVRI